MQRYAYHMNTTFNPERLLDIIDQLQAVLAPEIPRHIVRWGGQKDRDALETWQSPIFNSVARWEQNVDRMRRFAVERPASTIQNFVDHLRSGSNVLAVEIHQASNSADISFDGAFAGHDVALDQSAQYETPEIEITLAGDAQLTAFLSESTHRRRE